MDTATLSCKLPSLRDAERTLSPCTRSLVIVASFFCVNWLATPANAQGDDGGKFDGAIWNFTMTPRDKNLPKREGMFRVHAYDIYQRTDLDKPGFDRKVGRKTDIKAPRNKKGKVIGRDQTTIEFFDLQSNNRQYTGMKGKAEIRKDKQGHWSGYYVDSDGLNWDFKCSRKQE